MKRKFVQILSVVVLSVASYGACDRPYQGKDGNYSTDICDQVVTVVEHCEDSVVQGCSNCEECDPIDGATKTELKLLPEKPVCDEDNSSIYLNQELNLCSPICNKTTEYFKKETNECKVIPTCTADEYLDTNSYECKPIPLAKNKQDAVNRHNEVRDDHFKNAHLSWTSALEKSAKDCVDEIAESGDLKHCDSGNGENLYASTADHNFVVAINPWVEEEPYYHYDTNECDSGEMCGHYTQVVWEDTKEVGCAKKQIPKGDYKDWFVTICQYNPPGNYVGEKPY